jgi:hypothetical protein
VIFKSSEKRRNIGRPQTRWEDDFREEGKLPRGVSLIVDDDYYFSISMPSRGSRTRERELAFLHYVHVINCRFHIFRSSAFSFNSL